MYQSYDLSRYVDGDLSQSNSFTVSDHDTVNCAHMLAAGFNTMSRSLTGDFVLAVVNTKAGTVEYDGKIEKIKREEPWSMSQTFTFEPSAGDADTLLTLFGKGETPTFTAVGKVTVDGPSSVAHVKRDVLEAAYLELEAVKEVLFDAGVETIPADAGVRDLLAVKRAMSEQIAGLTHDREQANASARAELIDHVKRAYAKWGQVDPGRQNESLKSNLRGMIEVLSKFLAATGEADADERHAVAKRLCDIPEGNYLYED